MNCELCDALSEEYRLILVSEYSFVIVPKWPLKEGHVMILPKRHVAKYTDLTSAELYDLHLQVEKVSVSLSNSFSESPILFKNIARHSTQGHLHLHLLPSKGGLRELVGTYELVPLREDASIDTMKSMSDMMRKALASTKQCQDKLDEFHASMKSED